MSPLLSIVCTQALIFPVQTLDLSTMTSGWGVSKTDLSIQGQPLSVSGTKYRHGIGTHANSRLNLKLKGALVFESLVGIDDETKGKGSVEFIVLVDGTIKWRSGKMSGGDSAKKVQVDLLGARSVSLVVTDANDGQAFDHADWIEPTVTTKGEAPIPVRDADPIRIETAHSALQMYVTDDGRLFQRSFGANSATEDVSYLAYPCAGDGWIDEPAFRVTHADGNTSVDLRVIGKSKVGDLTKIEQKDPEYPLFVDLFFKAYPNVDVIETWTEVHHGEIGSVTLEQFSSSTPAFGKGDFYLTQFHGDWVNEANMSEEKLSFGIKTLDSKIGVRAHQFRAPWFLLSRGGHAQEDSGEVFGGSLSWSGSFAFSFEVDPQGILRALCGINPFDSQYHLKPNETFSTPKMIWGWSDHGTGDLSRKLQRWVRDHAIRGGHEAHPILLNNWEATYFTFDEKKIVSLFDGANDLGLELFLLDDGWFGSKYPRDDDSQGLGDWMPDPKKLPHGLEALAKAAVDRGLRFGIWLEPEMANPRSELFERHPDWVIRQPHRTLDLQRNQLILDLTRPEVKEYVFKVADDTLTENPSVSFVKWDCNRYVTQPGSTYLGAQNQSHLWVDYVRALYEIFQRLMDKHPKVEIMMCSGGGGRVDYAATSFAHEFWPSDMTDPAHRIFIQWGYSHFFPAIATANHVTLAGGHSMKFSFDVAMSGRLGMDVDLEKLPDADKAVAKHAVAIYKGIRDVVQLGEQYRLESPYAGPRSSLMYTKGNRGVVFVYSLGESGASNLKLKGIESSKTYRIREIDVAQSHPTRDFVMSGQTLLKEGFSVPALAKYGSVVYEFTAE